MTVASAVRSVQIQSRSHVGWVNATELQHVHYRNVIVRRPRVDYTEVWPDNGMVDMLAVMKELVRLKYNRMIIPEHARGLNVSDNVGERQRDPAGERGSRLAADVDPNPNSYAA